MSEELKMIIKLTEENTRFRAAMNYLKKDFLKDEERGYGNDGAKTALELAGMLDKEVEAITFENCPDVAMEVSE